jgi:hypothetical protein
MSLSLLKAIKMKKTAIIAGLGLVFSGLMAQTQQGVVQSESSVNEAKIVSIAAGSFAPDYDIKLYASREEAMLAEQGNNPSKPTTPDSDPKLEAEGFIKADVVAAPSRPTTPDADPKLNTESDLTSGFQKAPEVSTSRAGSDFDGLDANTGLEKIKAEGKITNYRDLKSDEPQVIPASQGEIINYRNITGPDDQPLEKPSVR